jgi:hypothetical protein
MAIRAFFELGIGDMPTARVLQTIEVLTDKVAITKLSSKADTLTFP